LVIAPWALASGAGMHRHFLQASFLQASFLKDHARFACKLTSKNCQDDNFGTGTS
jgi:hypothetical protein